MCNYSAQVMEVCTGMIRVCLQHRQPMMILVVVSLYIFVI